MKCFSLRYCEIYNMHNKKKLTSALHKEREHIIKYIQNIFRQKKEKYQEKDIEKFINNILSNYVQEVQSLRNKCQQNLGEHVSEIKKLQIIIKQLKENLSGAKELNDGEKFEEKNFKHDQEKLLDAENQRLNDLLEKTKEKYDKEIMETRMLWADMLKEWDDNNINSEAENCKLLEINEKFPNRHFEVDKRDAILVKKEQVRQVSFIPCFSQLC